MKLTLSLAASALAAATALSSAPGDDGTILPNIELLDFANTEATSLSDHFGQAVLLEFFAYW